MRTIAAGMGLGMLLAGASAWTKGPQSQTVSSTQPAVATLARQSVDASLSSTIPVA